MKPDDHDVPGRILPDDHAKLESLSAAVKALREVGNDEAEKLQKRLREKYKPTVQNQDATWLKRFARLEEEGEPGSRRPWLSGWVSAQRVRYKKGVLKEDRIAALERLPWWTWEAKGKR